jgi:hypothetical protein
MTRPATFLLQFQEKHPFAETPSASCGTKTITATMEDSDQDPRGLAPMLGGTQTVTNTTENGDQDVHSLAMPLAATQTVTKTIESSDQDPRGIAPLFAGTGTQTFTHENPDQDPRDMGTKTGTRTKEASEQEASVQSYFAIPRAECSSS